tara:strand:+ start:422 stop:1363 length:942 start_codon:yes stop_codon:yes gene_type:complete
MAMKKLFPYLSLIFTCGLFAADQEPATKTLVWSDGTRYVGEVIDGKRSGKGTIFWQDGTRFVGEFQNDMRNGPGTMIMPDGEVYSGIFKDGELIDTTVKIDVHTAEAPKTGEVLVVEAEEPMTIMETQAEPIIAAKTETTTETPVSGPVEEAIEEIIKEVLEDTVIESTKQPAETIASNPRKELPDVENAPYQSVTHLTDRVRSDVIETVDLWGAAWSEQNVIKYLSSYSEDFAVPGNLSRRGWEALRRIRLNRPNYIDLQIAYGRFELIASDTIDVYFRQTYRSNIYRDKTNKRLRLQREEQGWKIVEERSL